MSQQEETDSANTAGPYASPSPVDISTSSTVRYRVIGATTLAAVFLYLDRICIAEIAKLDEFKSSLGLSDQQTGYMLSAFFFSYALSQVPAGWLSDRFGARKMLPLYIGIWSICTVLTGLATGFVMLDRRATDIRDCSGRLLPHGRKSHQALDAAVESRDGQQRRVLRRTTGGSSRSDSHCMAAAGLSWLALGVGAVRFRGAAGRLPFPARVSRDTGRTP